MKKILAVTFLLASAQVAVSADRYAIITPGGTIDRFCQTCDPIRDALKPGYSWRFAPVVVPPDFNPDTQVRVGPTYTVGTSQVVEAWVVRAKTAQELSADRDDRADMGRDLMAVLCTIENHARAAAVPPGTPITTVLQCKAALRSMLP